MVGCFLSSFLLRAVIVCYGHLDCGIMIGIKGGHITIKWSFLSVNLKEKAITCSLKFIQECDLGQRLEAN